MPRQRVIRGNRSSRSSRSPLTGNEIAGNAASAAAAAGAPLVARRPEVGRHLFFQDRLQRPLEAVEHR